MSRRSTTPDAPDDPRRGSTHTPSAGSRLAPRNWRVATKLNAILLIPVLVALVLGGIRVYGSYERWQEATDAERTAELVRAATAYAHAVIDERDVTATPLLEGRDDDPVIGDARARTDEARDEFAARAAAAPDTANLRRRVAAVTEAETRLDTLRRQAYTDVLPGAATEEAYVAVQRPLMSFSNELGLGTGNLAAYGRGVYAVSLAKAASSLQRSLGTHLLVAPGPGEAATGEQRGAFLSYARLEEIARGEFTAAGTEDDARRLAAVTAEAGRRTAARQPSAPDLEAMTRLIAAGAAGEDMPEELTPSAWFRAATDEFEAYREIETGLVDAAVREAGDVASTARRDMALNAAAVLAAVLLAFLVAGLVARSMSRSMHRLRTAAFDVAGHRLPAVVDQLSRSDPSGIDTRVAPIDVHSRDEVGQIARAFDQIHREAVRLAGEQAVLRGNLSTLFSNLSSRNQELIERQLALISALESHEADPDQLASLFELDHLATRMRRNGENLLVLAGQEPEHRWDRPASLVDVLRAAASEVEDYARIHLLGVAPVVVRTGVVNDLVHLLAELLENATVFSSPQSTIRVTATRLPDGRVMAEIHDQGVGLPPAGFADINGRLADPPRLDAAVAGRMGLFVVSRLAERHGIRVQLRPAEGAGTTALVMLPASACSDAPEDAVTPESPASGPVGPLVRPSYDHAALEREGGGIARTGTSDPTAPPVSRRQGPRHARPPALDRADAPPLAPDATESAPGEHPTTQRGFEPVTPIAESPRGGPAGAAQRVGFTGTDPVVADDRAMTGAGLPRRERARQQPEEDPAQRLRDEPQEPSAPPTPGEAWRERGPRREERSGGTTSSGLPRRVPQAHLTEHSPPEPTPDQPQISRDPKDVRGRLSSLRRGVQQGRGARDARGAQNDEYDQER
ncbi:nitrate- and nitrite sensing domain-containing protein [Streptomyces avicenniae]|uniref:sensor histidine kinase n=1 Tax=Streptomyces avicenniae TaxID=500153 RepID=UPI000699B299|nr:nitrate- and nitrite sensing domain-containing protein [Streptomyces avicenniae]